MHKLTQYIRQNILQLTSWRRQFVAFVAGGATAFALNPFNLIFIGFITFPVLVLLLDDIAIIKSTKKRYYLAALTMWSFGFGYFVSTLWWLASALLIGPTALLFVIPLAIFGLPAYLALYWGLAGVVAMFFWQQNYLRFLALAVALGFFEYLRGIVFTGFPWGAIGYTIMPSPLFMQTAALIGLDSINILAVLIYVTPVILLNKNQRLLTATVGCLLIFFHIGFGAYRLHTAHAQNDYKTNYSVRIVQPSIAQDVKIDAQARQNIFETLISLSREPVEKGQKKPDFIIWPETSLPYILDYAPMAKARIAEILEPDQYAIIGAVRLDRPLNSQEDDNLFAENKHYFNTIEVINNHGQILNASDKLHLVPFGEYLPFKKVFDKIGLRGVAEVAGGYSAAFERRTVTMQNGFTYLPLICYEVIFPHGMEYKGNMPQAIINVTNDAWFGVTPGPYQHFQQARLRAVEQGLPLIRAANNGISAVVDSYGFIVAYLGQNKIGVVDTVIPQPIVPIWHGRSYLFHLFGLSTLFILLVFRMCRSKL